jgi:exonuclease VII large subunit
MEVSLSGGLMNPKMGLDSNLGTELAAGFQRHLNEKIEEAKAKLKSFVDDRIKGERSKLTAEFKKVEDSFNKVLKGKESELKNLQGELDKAFKEKGKAGSKKMQDDIKNQAKDALKRFGL